MVRQKGKSRVGGWLFLLAVIATYGVVGIVDVETTTQALVFFAGVMRNALPVLVLVFCLLLVADLLLEPSWIRRHLGRRAGFRGWFFAAIGGVLATGPIYPWYALLRELRQKGMHTPLVAVFLYSRAIKLPLLPLMVHYFGLLYTCVLCCCLFGFAILNGMLMRVLDKQVSAAD